MAQQWRSLAERRREHLLRLYRTGRWRKYYSEEQIMAQMRDVVREINEWEHYDHDDGNGGAPERRSDERSRPPSMQPQ
jgi:hypothetical protein